MISKSVFWSELTGTRWYPAHMVRYLMISATFNSLEEFSSYATNLSDIVAWTDFERINTTHFWSPMKQIFMEPDLWSEFQFLGKRQAFHLSNKILADFVIRKLRSLRYRFFEVVMAHGDGRLINGDNNYRGFCICKHLGKKNLS